MDKYKIIQVKESVFADNDREADRVRQQLKKQGTFLLNLMSSPGSGKTTTLLRTVEGLKDQLRMGVMEADIDSGAVKNAMILSVPEGHDKPLKYPLIFTVCDALIINKIDVLPYFDFDMDKVVEYAHRRNPNLKIFPISAKSGLGVDAWRQWLLEETEAWKKG